MELRSFRHWTPRYIRDRIGTIIYERTHPDHPWLTRTANSILESWLRPEDIGVEFGSGRSTLWFTRRVRFLTSVEHDKEWYDRVQAQLRAGDIDNVDYRLIAQDEDEERGNDSPYVKVADDFADASLDFVLIDGIYRDACANAFLRCLKPGAILIIDNANWFLPSATMSPGSRSHDDGPSTPLWMRFLENVSGWRYMWTTCGVFDTAIYVKPCS